MGEVWEAQDTILRRPVAVQVISVLAGGGSRADEARARFLREARITAALHTFGLAAGERLWKASLNAAWARETRFTVIGGTVLALTQVW
ncbi:hypothetical protein ACIQM0_28495 [Streptomyces sp. NPDC091387]|uniref:hypothetical protein n=1 Tax=Streptomyces sp. NPDC091387 TaxID=3365998 RepID=UPI0038056906